MNQQLKDTLAFPARLAVDAGRIVATLPFGAAKSVLIGTGIGMKWSAIQIDRGGDAVIESGYKTGDVARFVDGFGITVSEGIRKWQGRPEDLDPQAEEDAADKASAKTAAGDVAGKEDEANMEAPGKGEGKKDTETAHTGEGDCHVCGKHFSAMERHVPGCEERLAAVIKLAEANGVKKAKAEDRHDIIRKAVSDTIANRDHAASVRKSVFEHFGVDPKKPKKNKGGAKGSVLNPNSATA